MIYLRDGAEGWVCQQSTSLLYVFSGIGINRPTVRKSYNIPFEILFLCLAEKPVPCLP